MVGTFIGILRAEEETVKEAMESLSSFTTNRQVKRLGKQVKTLTCQVFSTSGCVGFALLAKHTLLHLELSKVLPFFLICISKPLTQQPTPLPVNF